MKILVYGVHHWFSKLPKKEIKLLRHWEDRIRAFIPDCEIFVTTGCYSDPTQSPFSKDIPIIQNKIPYTKPYNLYHNYFRNGFMTGIWHSLLNHDNWDIVFHIQPRVLLGVPMEQIIETFLQSESQILTPNMSSESFFGYEISFLGMKPGAVKVYSQGGCRNSFVPENQTTALLSVEEELYLLFHKVRYNPWPNIMTTRQIDSTADGFGASHVYSPFTMLDIQEYSKLPLISTGKHATKEFVDYWKKQHKI